MLLPEHRRVTRAETLGGKAVDYDMKYHPMDDILRPKAAAKRRSNELQTHQVTDNDENKGFPDEDLEVDLSISADPLIDNQMMITRERHRVTRAETLGGRAVDYDMKHHPMDDVLRPKTAAKRSVWFKSVSPSTISPKTAKAENIVLINKNDPKNPFSKPTPTNWKELRAFDRRVYLLQRGSPIDGNTLPLKWLKVVEALIEDGYFTRGEFKAWGGVEALKERYENIRVGIEGFFKAKQEPTSKMGWQVVHAEGVDVFEDGEGNVVPPPSSRDRKESHEEQADSENDDEEDDHPEVCDSYDLRMADASDDKIDSDTELEMRGGDASSTILPRARATSQSSPVSYHDAEHFLQAEDHLVESMRSQPSSEIGPLMADDELDAVLGEMASPKGITEAMSSEQVPSNSSSEPDTSAIEFDRKSQQTPPIKNAAEKPRNIHSSTKSPPPTDGGETTNSKLEGVVPSSVLKATRRFERQNSHIQASKQTSPRPSTSANSSKEVNPNATTQAPTTRKAPKKVYKRGSRTKSSSVEFQVHEDQPGNTPLIKRRVALHPKSPGTDIKKENFDHQSLLDAGSTAAHRRLQQATTGSPSTTRRSGIPVVIPGTSLFEQGSSALTQLSPGFVVADGRAAGIDRMGPGAFVTPLTPRSARMRRV